MTTSKDMQQLLSDMQEQGFEVTQRSRRSSRLRVKAPDGELTFMGTSVGDNKSVANARSWAASHGLATGKGRENGLSDKTARKGRPGKGPVTTAAAAARRVASASTRPPRSVFEDADAEPEEVPVPSEEPVEEPAPEPIKRQRRTAAGSGTRLGTQRVEPQAAPSAPRAAVAPSEDVPDDYNGLPRAHPAWPVGTVVPLGDGVWLEPVRMVGPELAAAWLDWNTWNRNAPGRTVGGYSRDMRGGSFYEKQGDPIRFAVTGQLLDGQQRLMSLLESGKTVQFVVISGLPTSAQETMDSGRRRTVADQLKLAQVATPEVVGSAAKTLWEMDHNSFLSRVPSPTNSEIFATVMECQEGVVDLETAAKAVAPARRVVRMQSVAAAIYWLQAEISIEDTERFWDMLATGMIPEEDMSVLALRETLLRRIENKTLRRPADAAYLIIRAWNAWRRGVKQKSFLLPKTGITSENFPRLI